MSTDLFYRLIWLNENIKIFVIFSMHQMLKNVFSKKYFFKNNLFKNISHRNKRSLNYPIIKCIFFYLNFLRTKNVI
jgi:hypothetical protein